LDVDADDYEYNDDDDKHDTDDDYEREERTFEEATVAYVQLNQDVSGGNDRVPVRVERFAKTVDKVRLNTNAVYLATIYTKIGWNTNLRVTF
jgi:hypothetical protein